MRTIIDLLQRGNLELFHSSMIAWFLDPEGEHGMGRTFLDRFAQAVALQGWPDLQTALSRELPTISIETAGRGVRCDISLRFSDGCQFIIENKVKSVGNRVQLERYQSASTKVIAIGLTEASFDGTVADSFPLVRYQYLLDILEDQPPALGTTKSGFEHLIEHYARYLKRELELLALVHACYFEGDFERHGELADRLTQRQSRSRNDTRFVNLCYMEALRTRFERDELLSGAGWYSEKNQQSGVWMAHREAVPRFSFSKEIFDLCTHFDAKLWFHLELHDGVFTRRSQDQAGVLQLRATRGSAPKEFVSAFHRLGKTKEHQKGPKSIKDTAQTFYCVQQPLLGEKLFSDAAVAELTDLMAQFGTFSD